MTGPLVGSERIAARHSAASPEKRARCAIAKWLLGIVGFFGYLIPGLLVSIAVSNLIEAFGGSTTVAVRLGVGIAVAVFAAWRGATVAAIVRPSEVYVRNRWRRTVVPFGEIEAVEVGSSVPYGLIGFVLWIRYVFSDYSVLDTELLDQSDMLIIRRRGRRRRLAVYATLGMAWHLDDMQPFLDALAAAGHPVEQLTAQSVEELPD